MAKPTQVRRTLSQTAFGSCLCLLIDKQEAGKEGPRIGLFVKSDVEYAAGDLPNPSPEGTAGQVESCADEIGSFPPVVSSTTGRTVDCSTVIKPF